jgi:hypothetical protein
LVLTRVYTTVHSCGYRILVTGTRVAKFLKLKVVDRPHKTRGKAGGKGKGKTVAPSGETPMTEAITGPVKTLGWKSLEQYLCALCYMQKQQMAATGRVINSPRRFPAVIALQATLKRKEADRKKNSFVDRCKGWYTPADMPVVMLIHVIQIPFWTATTRPNRWPVS